MAYSIQSLIQEIISQNYWRIDLSASMDPDVQKIGSSHLKYTPKPIAPADCLAPGIITLRGPRRSGKSIAVKQLILTLIQEENWDPNSILWFTAETTRTMANLERIIIGLVKECKPRMLCIDEVSGVRGWQNVIKKLVDTGTLSACVVILTGSSAYDIKTGSERMAGRRGMVANPDRILLPMDFTDFCIQVRRHLPDMNDKDLCQHYLVCGGFPFRVNHLIDDLKSGRAFDPFSQMQVLDDVFFYEIQRRKLDRSIALEVMSRLAANGCGALSYEGFAKSLSISRDSVRRYLDALGDAFLVATISSYDTGGGRVAPKKDRKFIWIDPALTYMSKSQGQGPEWDEASRAELLVFASMLRHFEKRIWEGLSAPRNVFTWKSSSGNEIDVLVVDRSQKLLFPVEVKWQNVINDWDFQVMERAFGRGVLVTKSFEKSRIKSQAVPLTEFLFRGVGLIC